MGPVSVAGDVVGSFGTQSGAIYCLEGKIASVAISGSLSGGGGSLTGQVISNGSIGPVTIGGNIVGGDGGNSGIVESVVGSMISVAIKGSLIGGALGDLSGAIVCQENMAHIVIGGNVTGGSGDGSAEITTQSGGIVFLEIDGSLTGGSGDHSGGVFSTADLDSLHIGGNLVGGHSGGTSSLDVSGYVVSAGGIGSVTITGSITSGISYNATTPNGGGTIRARNAIGSLTVDGSLLGNDSGNVLSPVVISAGFSAHRGHTSPILGSLVVGGDVEFANILAGYDPPLDPVNADAQIGQVVVTGDWIASNLIAGAVNSASQNIDFGNAGDSTASGNVLDTRSVKSQIVSITINGTVIGTDSTTNAIDHFGFVAQQIGTLTIHGTQIHLTPGPSNDNLPLGDTGDFNLHEIAS